MREFVRSMIRCSLAVGLLGIKQVGSLFSLADWIPGIAKGWKLSEPIPRMPISEQLRNQEPTSKAGDSLPRAFTKMMDAMLSLLPLAPVTTATESGKRQNTGLRASSSRASLVRSSAIQSGRLSISRFTVIGEGLAAGMGDFSLSAETQLWSFPAQMAKQMQARFVQQLIQSPGIRHLVGFADMPVLIPAPLQTTVIGQLPPVKPNDLSIPAFTVSDALNRRPVTPLIQRDDPKQTAVNLVWGVHAISQGKPDPLPTQLEYALEQSPTFAVVELGYYEALEAAVLGDQDRLPACDSFSSQYAQIIGSLKDSGSEVLVVTIPDPLDTAHFSTLEAAARTLKVDPAFLLGTYGLRENDLLTVNGLNEISYQLFANLTRPLPANSILRWETARTISSRIRELNSRLRAVAEEKNAVLYDLSILFSMVRKKGVAVGSKILSAEYLGGFYSLNGYYPGRTGQAIIVNGILQKLNQTYGASFPLIDATAVMKGDPVAAYQPARGPTWKTADLRQRGLQSGRERSVSGGSESTRRSATGASDVWKPLETNGAPARPLRLPPGLDQVLPLNEEASYFGDGISPIHAFDPKDMQWGSSGNFLFGGLAMVDSHLRGSIRIKFMPPVGNQTRFEVSFLQGFVGADSVLVAPQFFKMAFQQNRVDDVPDKISSGSLNLITGEVSELVFYARYSSTALLALVSVNPNFPKQPLSFPGPYGSAWAQFDQRADGKLDFTFYGSTFVPLGPGTVWPLNFVGPSKEFATVPARGTVMHPHLQLSTRHPDHCEGIPGNNLEIPFNTIQELTLHTHNSSFGDGFRLNVPALGGPAKGRSELLGRLQVQFGGRTGNSVPIAVWALRPGGIMAELPESPVTQVFPSRLSPGPQGFNENLRFPQRTYPLDDLSILDDPFDISIGALDLNTGRTLNDLLHRAFISQDLLFALLRVEPRTPKSSFLFRGPGLLQRDSSGQMVFRFRGELRIPYPEGFQFPHPDFATGFAVGPNSYLDPFLWFHSVQDTQDVNFMKEGMAHRMRSSTGDEFSYHYAISGCPARHKPIFEYENHTQGGRFTLHSLAWLGFSNSGNRPSGEDRYDTITFTGFGVWSKDGVRSLQQMAAQISTGEKPYVGIQISSGDISNVNTKPENERDALP